LDGDSDCEDEEEGIELLDIPESEEKTCEQNKKQESQQEVHDEVMPQQDEVDPTSKGKDLLGDETERKAGWGSYKRFKLRNPSIYQSTVLKHAIL